MTIRIQPGDITQVRADAIVNAANSTLLGGGGVDGAIHRVGGPSILAECEELRATRWPDGLPAGQAVATGAGELPARWVIHTVGPVFSTAEDRSEILASAYRESIRLAVDLGAESVAFPTISAGAYGWPLDDAVRIAVTTARAELARLATQSPERDLEVIFVPFGETAMAAFHEAMKPHVLFVCVKNAGKSQMAAALARLRAKEAGIDVVVHSAGTTPGAGLNQESAASVAEIGADFAGEYPKGVDPELLAAARRVIIIGREAQLDTDRDVERWDTVEPSLQGIEGAERMNMIREDLDARVRTLLAELAGDDA